MNSDNFNEYVADAQYALNNQKIELAKEYYEKAYKQRPENIDVLNKLGNICMMLGEFDKSFAYFEKLVKLEPDNGDNYYNLGNAYFFNTKYKQSMESYVEAISKGCSEDILPRVYYQLALLCSIQGNAKASLINFQKYEDTDPTGLVGVSQDVLTEKIKLYMLEQDYVNAEKTAKILINATPDVYEYYEVLFNIEIALEKYAEAEKILADSGKYIQLNYSQNLSKIFHLSLLYITMADTDTENSEKYLKKSLEILNDAKEKMKLTLTNSNEISSVLAEVYMKLGDYDSAIQIAKSLIEELPVDKPTNLPNTDGESQEEYSEENAEDEEPEIDEEVQKAIEAVSELYQRVENGEIDNLVDIDYDEDGNEIKVYNESLLDIGSSSQQDGTSETFSEIFDDEKSAILSKEEYTDKVYNVLVTCYAVKEEYNNVLKYVDVLIRSNNKAIATFGVYIKAFSARELAKAGKEQMTVADNLYNRAIAYFKTQMFQDRGNREAVVYRARLYAENGKFILADEMAKLLDDETHKSLTEYILKCREELKV